MDMSRLRSKLGPAGRTSVLRWSTGAMGTLALLIAVMSQPALAATLCVNQHGTKGCFSSINAALGAAAVGDTIRVASGTYKEYVTVTRSVSLIGQSRDTTTIDASKQPFGINVDGYNNPGLSGVVILGFTVENADNAGIVVSNASDVTIEGNRVTKNDQGFVPGTNPTCPTLDSFPYFFGEAMDCGEGVFFSGVDHSTIAGNIVVGNDGGLLVADDTGATHDNVISGNTVAHNALDCGITIPSHGTEGVFHNTVADNEVSYNGAAGVGIYAPGPGSKAYANLVIHNELRGNGIPGVVMHNHAAPGVDGVPAGAPPVMFNDNVIVGNDISGNSADTADAATAGPTGINVFSLAPMTGTVISQNSIHDEQLDIVVNVPASGMVPVAEIHLNNLLGRMIGVQDITSAEVNATENWWGCPNGPGAAGCSTVSGSDVMFAPWLTQPFGQLDDHRH